MSFPYDLQWRISTKQSSVWQHKQQIMYIFTVLFYKYVYLVCFYFIDKVTLGNLESWLFDCIRLCTLLICYLIGPSLIYSIVDSYTQERAQSHVHYITESIETAFTHI